jgi:hypothetical protein
MTLPDPEMATRQPPRSRFWQLAIIILLALSFIVAQRYGNELMQLVTDPAEATAITPPPCNLNRQACQLPIITPVASEAPWTFSISPQPIPVSAPLIFTLTPPARVLTTHAPSTVWVDLTGDDMDMGLIRIPLVQDANGQWTGSGSIPVCITGAMRWRARLHIQLVQTRLQADWIFTAPENNLRH